MKKIFLKIIIISLCLSTLIGILFIIFGGYSSMFAKLLGTTGIILAFSFVGLRCSRLYDNHRYIVLSVIGMGLAALAAIYFSLYIWEVIKYVNVVDKLSPTLITLNIYIMWLCHLLYKDADNKTISNIIIATCTCLTILAALCLILFWFIDFSMDISEFHNRVIGVFALLSVLGTILIPILNKINMNKIHVEEIPNNDLKS